MKTHIKREKKKYPYHRQKHNIFAQIRNREQRKTLMLPNYAIIDKKGNIIEKYRLRMTADVYLKKLSIQKLDKLRICKLDEDGKVGVIIVK